VTKEAHLEDVGSGLAPVTEGWFVVNVRDAAWETSGLGGMCAFEGVDVPFAQLGINVRALTPGSSGLSHSESNQEDFLVVAGECLLEGKERPLKTWDFVHGPPGTEHAFVATPTGPA
jgi:quercetin dioxygenase-like cupin family protein